MPFSLFPNRSTRYRSLFIICFIFSKPAFPSNAYEQEDLEQYP